METCSTGAARTFDEALDRLVARALVRDVSPEVAQEARRATTRVMQRADATGALSAAQERRAGAYFSAVVRRRALRRGEPPRGAARVVVAAVVEDLRASGRDGEAIWDQLRRGWSDAVPGDVLEEYRLRLCG
jgi:hypothetical protein